MNDKFAHEEWAKRLPEWTRKVEREASWVAGLRDNGMVKEVGPAYRDKDGNTRAFIIDYTHQDGSTFRAVRQLRDDAGNSFNAAPAPQ